MSTLIAHIAVAAPLDKTLSYAVPEALRSQARIGVRVRVPLGRRQAVGFLLFLAEEQEAPGLKQLAAVLDREPLFSPEMVGFFRWAADYYRHPLGEVIRSALPAGLSGRQERVGILTEAVFSATERSDEPPGARQRQILGWLRASGAAPMSAVARKFPASHAVLRRLVELGYLVESEAERSRDPFRDQAPAPDRPVTVTPEQEAALTAIGSILAEARFGTFLLHGVTGSGKTEVYLQAIAAALDRGRQALVLVPEIALTPQLVGRFRARFANDGVRIAILHSGLSDGERYDAWRTVARGEAAIVIGARSAVFAPLPDLGIIVVDEEHETSYKQAEGFRYHARDLALVRGQMARAAVVLGSATPALNTYYRAQVGQSAYLPLAARVLGRPMPAVQVIDLAADRPAGTLSAPLAAALRENLDQGGQALLLLNRRGFSPYLLCAECGQTFRCPNCVITLTYHQGNRRLRCHYCDYAAVPPATCPRCQGAELRPEGAGTERLEEELAELLPDARIARMDRDTTARKGTHLRLVEAMERREVDVLVGTQMVAKGHDFPGVTLVGVVQADSTLNFPDFRSAERTFALLTQVAGRAGRGEMPGRVLVQTWSPEHYAITCAARHDYAGFFAEETAMRRELAYPPFGHLVNLIFAGLDDIRTSQAAGRLAAALEQQAAGVEVLGPAPCPLARLRGRSRFQVLLKAPERSALRRLLPAVDELRRQVPRGISLAVDVDPVDML